MVLGHVNCAISSLRTRVRRKVNTMANDNKKLDRPEHHSKAKGAVIGAATGGFLAGKKGAAAGAAIGAEKQHKKNVRGK